MYSNFKQLILKMKVILYTLAVASALTFGITNSNAQISLTNSSPSSTTNFDGWDGTLPAGFSHAGPAESLTYRGNSESASTGGTYAIPLMGLGFQASSSANAYTLTGTFTNNTTVTIEYLRISYDAFTIFDRSSRIPSWTVSIDGLEIPDLQWTYGDGDVTMTWDISGLSIPVGNDFTIEFFTDRGTGTGSTPKIGLNNISVTIIDASGGVLPVELGKFTAEATNTSNMLYWNTLSEKDQNSFEIQRSEDGRNFHTIHTIRSNGYASQYQFEDKSATSTLNYYRIVYQNNGNTTYSNTVKVENNALTQISIYPNPAHNEINIKSNVAGSMLIRVYDINGRIVMTQSSASNNCILDVNQLMKGQYFIEIENNNSTSLIPVSIL